MKELAIFDLDNTLIKKQSQVFLLAYALKKGHVGFFSYIFIMLWFIAYKIGLVKNPKRIMEFSFNFLKNKNIDEFESIIDDFFENKLKSTLFVEALRLVEKHKRNGRETLIVSNAIEYIPKKVAQYLGIDYFIGTKLEIVNNKFTGKIKGDIIYGRNKVTSINDFVREKGFSLDNSYGYSDHYSDIPFLEMVANPFAVNPDSKLQNKAKRENWPILIFKQTIKL